MQWRKLASKQLQLQPAEPESQRPAAHKRALPVGVVAVLKNDVQAVVNQRSSTDWRGLISEWVHDEKDRHILTRTLLDGATYERVAEEIDMSVDQTKKRNYRARKQLFSHL